MDRRITIEWDPESFVWVAKSRQVPGLALEDPSADALIERVRREVPALLERNGLEPCGALVFEYGGPNCR